MDPNDDMTPTMAASDMKPMAQIEQKNCIIIYSQCSFKGEQLEACDNLNKLMGFQHPIRSIYIPDGLALTIYDKPNFQGEKHRYTDSQSCLMDAVVMT